MQRSRVARSSVRAPHSRAAIPRRKRLSRSLMASIADRLHRGRRFSFSPSRHTSERIMESDNTFEAGPIDRRFAIVVSVAAMVIAIVAGLSVDRQRTPKSPAPDSATYRADWNTWHDRRAKNAVAPGRPLSYTGLT